MSNVIYEMLAENGDVSVKFFECDTETAQEGMITVAYDMIDCLATAMKPGITFETLLEVPGYVLAPASHSFATRRNIALCDLSGQKLVLLDLPVISEYYATQFDAAGLKPKIVATATYLELVRSLVGHGVGCSVLHMVTSTGSTYAGDKVAAVPLKSAIDPFKIGVGHLPANPRRLVKVFWDTLREYFQIPDARVLRVLSGE